jgi:hypothetical protein
MIMEHETAGDRSGKRAGTFIGGGRRRWQTSRDPVVLSQLPVGLLAASRGCPWEKTAKIWSISILCGLPARNKDGQAEAAAGAGDGAAEVAARKICRSPRFENRDPF